MGRIKRKIAKRKIRKRKSRNKIKNMKQILFHVSRSVEEHRNRKLQASNKTICVFYFRIPKRNTKIRSYKLVIKLNSDIRVPHCGKRKFNSVAFGHLEDLGTDLNKLWAAFWVQIRSPKTIFIGNKNERSLWIMI